MGTASVIRMPDTSENIDASGRYDQGYRVAERNLFFSEFVKAVGVLAAALMLVTTVAFSAGSGDALLFGAIVAVSVGLALYALGAILCAQGHMLRATLDATVSASPFLTPTAKARAMSLARKA